LSYIIEYNMPIKRLILASSSPRRKELLEEIGLQFEVIPGNVREVVTEGESPINHVVRLAKEKALAVAVNLTDSWVIGADTIVLLDGEILGKPAGVEDACRMLLKLNGKKHRVITGFCIHDIDRGETITSYVETIVTFNEVSEEEILNYIKTGEPFDKAGGYAIQGMGSFLVKEIEGSYTNVVGLPVDELKEVLKRLGVIRSTGRSLIE